MSVRFVIVRMCFVFVVKFELWLYSDLLMRSKIF